MPISKSTALAVVDNFAISPTEIAEMAQSIKEEIGAMGPLDLPRTNVPAGGVLAWSIKATADDPRPAVVEALEGVIICHHAAYAYYSNPTPAPGTRPDCSSRDGFKGTTIDGEVLACETCPYNRWGSGIKADGSASRGKACKNAWMLYLLREGAILPTMVKISPTGVKPLKSYFQGLLVPSNLSEPRRRPHEVITRITLRLATSGDGTKYAIPEFEAVAALSKEAAESLHQYGLSFAGMAPVADELSSADDDLF